MPQRYRLPTATKIGGLLGLAGAALAGASLIAHYHAKRAEQRHPPRGRFVTSQGVRLHYIEQGSGFPVVFLHGNGAMIDDYLISGVFGLTAKRYRAIAFDRPGFGYSERPRGRHWTPGAQAALLPGALKLIGVDRAIVVGHSWGTLVALCLALEHPRLVVGLLLAAGYYFPTPRTDVTLFSPPALPVVGNLISHTVAPLVGEALAPYLIDRMFFPQGVSPRFKAQYPLGLALRPSQIKAFAEDTAQMVTAAEALSERYGRLFPPAVIMAGDADKVVDYRQAQQLHDALPGSQLDILPGGSHMVHHLDPQRFVRNIERAVESVTG